MSQLASDNLPNRDWTRKGSINPFHGYFPNGTFLHVMILNPPKNWVVSLLANLAGAYRVCLFIRYPVRMLKQITYSYRSSVNTAGYHIIPAGEQRWWCWGLPWVPLFWCCKWMKCGDRIDLWWAPPLFPPSAFQQNQKLLRLFWANNIIFLMWHKCISGENISPAPKYFWFKMYGCISTAY